LVRRLACENAPGAVLASIVVATRDMAEDVARDLLRDPSFRAHLRSEIRFATSATLRALRASLLAPRQASRASRKEA
jgi:hypothetical protein